MSKFKTAIAVDVEAVKRLLPKGSYIHGVDWNKETNSVELTWEHDALKTPYTFASDYSLAHLQGEAPAAEPVAAGDSVPTPAKEVVAAARRRR